MRDLLEQLPGLPLSADKTIDFLNTDKAVLEKLAEDAETTVRTIHAGITAFGHLMVHSAVPLEAGEVGAPSLEAVGWTLAQMGDLAAVATSLAAGCRTALAYVPRQSRPQQRRP